jgi:hypothetical protein
VLVRERFGCKQPPTERKTMTAGRVVKSVPQ